MLYLTEKCCNSGQKVDSMGYQNCRLTAKPVKIMCKKKHLFFSCILTFQFLSFLATSNFRSRCCCSIIYLSLVNPQRKQPTVFPIQKTVCTTVLRQSSSHTQSFQIQYTQKYLVSSLFFCSSVLDSKGITTLLQSTLHAHSANIDIRQ